MARKAKGYWTEKTIMSELNPLIDEFGHFPTKNELIRIDRNDLNKAICSNGGYNYFRDKMGYDFIRTPWDKKAIFSELKRVIDELGYFPTRTELYKMGKSGLSVAIVRNGGYNYFRDKLGYDVIQKSPGYWTEGTIISELKLVIDELGHFPFHKELCELGKSGLANAIPKHSSFNYFRDKMGYKCLQKSYGYWTDDIIISKLNTLIDEHGRFPSRNELCKMGNGDLVGAMKYHGGGIYFRRKCGFSSSMQEKYKFELASYVNKRAQKSEQFVKDIIIEWTEVHNKPRPNYNVRLSKGNVIEFVCGLNKKIGIDVTNTKSSKSATYEQIKNKWRHREYHLHLDELWIVVFTDVLTATDYEKLNKICPENVKVFSIYMFLNELNYSAKNYSNIDLLNKCTFHNKEEIINTHRIFDE